MIFSVKQWASVVPLVREAFVRFPLPIFCGIIVTLCALIKNHEVEFVADDIIGKIFAEESRRLTLPGYTKN